MEERCRYCQAEVTYDTLVCPKCGSPLVDVERRRKVWPLVAIGAGVVVAGLAVYLFATWSSEVATTTPAPTKPKVDSTAVQIAQDDERNRLASEEMNRKWKEEQDRKAAALAEKTAWEGRNGEQRVAFLTKELASLSKEVAQLKASKDANVAQEAATLESLVANAEAFLKAGSLDVAFESFKSARDQARDLARGAAPSTLDVAPNP